MKKIAVIYRNRENPEAIHYLSKNLEQIFGEYIFIENYHLNEIPRDFTILADVYLVADDSMIYRLRSNIPNFNNLILMKRSLSKKHLQEVRNLPKNTNVLVVNDTYENAVQTIYSLYEIDITHVNFIPYDPYDINNFKYRDLKICVTPNEQHLVPPHIEEIINIGYREISFDTIAQLKKKLNLDYDSTNRNLIHHLRSIEEPSNGFHDDYISNFLITQVLKNLSNKLDACFFIVNESYELIYSNDRADVMFNITELAPLSQLLGEDLAAAMRKELPPKSFVAADGERYFIEKNAVLLMDEIIGYCFTLQRERDLMDMKLQAKKMQEQKGLFAKYTFSDIVHASPSMDKCISLAKTAAATDYAVLITGESGVGKELIAQSIHNFSPRSASSFVAINCAALPESLLESELFGYEGGSFTGASKSGKIGLFEQANGGTIFLDEIGDTSPHLQSRLLRVLQEHQVVRIGSDRVIDIDIRIVAATNKDLREEVAKGNFRKDLFYRLNVINVNVEPLRNRKEDILPLMSHFLGARYKELTERHKNQLLRHDWPGNIRELESAAIHFGALSALPNYLCDNADSAGPSPGSAPESASTATSPSSSATDPCSPARSVPARSTPTGDEFVAPPDSRTIDLEILKIISRNTHSFHGIGRAQLIRLLNAIHIEIGDGNLRAILKGFQQRGLIEIGRGREGTRITDEGIREIQSLSSQIAARTSSRTIADSTQGSSDKNPKSEINGGITQF